MVTDAGGNVGDALLLSNVARKGKRGGRTAPFAGVLRDALVALKASETASMDRNNATTSNSTALGMNPLSWPTLS